MIAIEPSSSFVPISLQRDVIVVHRSGEIRNTLNVTCMTTSKDATFPRDEHESPEFAYKISNAAQPLLVISRHREQIYTYATTPLMYNSEMFNIKHYDVIEYSKRNPCFNHKSIVPIDDRKLLTEYADIVYVYGLCDGSSLRAVAEYKRRFPNRRVHIEEYLLSMGLGGRLDIQMKKISSRELASGKIPKMLAAFPRWMAIPIRCRSKDDEDVIVYKMYVFTTFTAYDRFCCRTCDKLTASGMELRYMPPDHVFRLTEKELRTHEYITLSSEYYEIMAMFGNVKVLGKDWHTYDLKSVAKIL
ncbi:hypothetical protein ANN_24552 [Periplaneta americana]|uniref:Uncharacterized protein n=1 Tax=Periplaneta americana TaxID=6978 RepID=A0ABQ8S3T6_PERAM|nr:hypothetical protein ANN_24552 [Periplaneta americana]